MKIGVLIVAAGKGLRAGGGEKPKQYHTIGDRPVLSHTINAFALHNQIHHIICAIHPDHAPLYDSAIGQCHPKGTEAKLGSWVSGGRTRQETVARGLEALTKTDCTHVLIHDGARPFISAELITRIIEALQTHDVVLPALAVTDTLKYIENGYVKHTVDRSPLWAAQTPQAFHLPLIWDLHQQAVKSGQHKFTDDIALAEWQDKAIFIVQGQSSNTKITTADDLILADLLMKMKENK